MMNTQLKEIAKVWPEIQPIFSVPHNKNDYNRLVNLLDKLVDEVGNNETHYLASLMETIGSLIETYESQYINKIEGNPIGALKALMADHDMKQSDLSEIGSQGVISEILSGKRQLNVRQIKMLSELFNVSPAVFV
ncbi:MAG: helix-turn-helix domain-containing protein [Desulfobacterales bacterium]|jgi:HTH-type transcriptional regulator/antitoxin HigA|nr:helix-turn-helix domain-containing protein [Desulfobacterales bacterium]